MTQPDPGMVRRIEKVVRKLYGVDGDGLNLPPGFNLHDPLVTMQHPSDQLRDRGVTLSFLAQRIAEELTPPAEPKVLSSVHKLPRRATLSPSEALQLATERSEDWKDIIILGVSENGDEHLITSEMTIADSVLMLMDCIDFVRSDPEDEDET